VERRAEPEGHELEVRKQAIVLFRGERVEEAVRNQAFRIAAR
jgi:hypothetical protein